MTEDVILRVIVVSSLVWFCISEWRHSKQLDAMFQAGFRYAVKNHIKKVQDDIDQFYRDFKIDIEAIQEAIKRDDEQADAERTRQARNTEVEKPTYQAHDAE